MTTTTGAITPDTLRDWLMDGREIALLDIREEGQHGEGHPLLSVNLPYSRLERDIGVLVPRRSTRMVLLDDGDGVADRAARHLASAGYANVSRLAGGIPGWAAAGQVLFESSNVPSKAFAEIVELTFGTPHVEAPDLHAMRAAGRDVVVLDSRTVEEFGRFHVPGAISCPGVELVHRFDDLVPSKETFVVVSCAGRTRGIIGAQALIDAGIPNRVAALAGGTQGWRLAGFELERNVPASTGLASEAAARAAQERAATVAARTGVARADLAALAAWRAETERTTHLLDVRTPDEFAAGHLPGAVSAQGGQLVQAIDRWVGTRGARLVLTDDDGVRATLAAHWLKQMGWDVHILPVPAGSPLLIRESAQETLAEPGMAMAEAAAWLRQGAASIFIGPSAGYRAAHPRGSVWASRARLDRLPGTVLSAGSIVVFAEDVAAGHLAVKDLAAFTAARVGVACGGPAVWRASGIAVEASPGIPPDGERIDYLFWNHDRHEGNAEAMRSYLRWETELPARITADGTAGFQIATG